MGKSRYREEQMAVVSMESDAGPETAELCRKHGFSERTLYRGKAGRSTANGYTGSTWKRS